jgi:ABC-2 type transport system ATP-binding protein
VSGKSRNGHPSGHRCRAHVAQWTLAPWTLAPWTLAPWTFVVQDTAEEQMEHALEAHGIGKQYRRGRPWALHDVSLAVPAGSITALVGPNGAGKSTLIKGYVGFERPTAGRLAIGGVDPWRNRGEAVRRIGYVPQAASLYRELTVAEHLSLAARWRPGFDRPLAESRLALLAIPLAVRADELSGGQQAQVGLAIALGTRAPVLLLDEPLASLDPLARREFLHVMVDTVREVGATALLSSHVITDIEQACDRMVVLGGGRVLLDAPIAEARAAHRLVEGDGPVDADRLVGRFPDAGGRMVALVRNADGGVGAGADGRSATLEEVVLGHLVAGRAVAA